MTIKNARAILKFAALTTAATIPALAQAQEADATWDASSAVTADAFFSSDSDDIEVVKVGIGYDWHYAGPEQRFGVRLETAQFAPQGEEALEEQRVYLRAAHSLGDWTWTAMPGTNGDTLLGSASIHNDDRYRQEYFIERERVETPQGLSEDLYYTFVGGAVDLPLGGAGGCCQLNSRVVIGRVGARCAICRQNRHLGLGGSGPRRTQPARGPRSAQALCD